MLAEIVQLAKYAFVNKATVLNKWEFNNYLSQKALQIIMVQYKPINY